MFFRGGGLGVLNLHQQTRAEKAPGMDLRLVTRTAGKKKIERLGDSIKRGNKVNRGHLIRPTMGTLINGLPSGPRTGEKKIRLLPPPGDKERHTERNE